LALKKLAKQLAIKANVPYGQKLDFSHLDKVQKILDDYQIVLIDAETKSIKYLGKIKHKKYWQCKQLYLSYHKNELQNLYHVNTITSILGYLTNGSNTKFSYCLPCNKSFQWPFFHNCEYTCICCKTQPPHTEGPKINCDDCHRSFNGNECYNKHSIKTNRNKNACIVFTKCQNCKGFTTDRKPTRVAEAFVTNSNFR